MGLLSILGKIGGIAAAPFTGGMSLIPTALSAAGDIAGVLGKQQGGAAQGRAAQAQLQQGQDRNAIDLYQAQQGAQNQAASTDLQRKGFELTSRRTNNKDALLAALLGGYQPGSVGVPGITNATMSGGLAATLKDPAVLAAIQKLGSGANTAQDTPLAFQGGNLIAAPSLTALPQQSKGSSFLDTLARVGQIAGAASPYIKPKREPMDESPGNPGDWGGYG